MNNNFGIYNRSYELLLQAIKQFPEIEKSVIFGSRAIGNYKNGSDVDLAIFGKKINFKITSCLHGTLNEELPIPYFFDVIDFNTLNNIDLKKHILEKGVIIFDNKNQL